MVTCRPQSVPQSVSLFSCTIISLEASMGSKIISTSKCVSIISGNCYCKTNFLKIDYLRCWILHQFSNGANTANANAMHVWCTSFFNAVSCANLMFQFRIVAATHELSNVLENPGKKNLFRIWLFFSHGWYYQGTKQFGSVAFSQRNKPLCLKWIKCSFWKKLKLKRIPVILTEWEMWHV